MINYLNNKICLLIFVFLTSIQVVISQEGNISSLQIKEIMQGDDFVGHLPNSISWSVNSDLIYFNWNPSGFESDSLFCYQTSTKKIVRIKSDSLIYVPNSGWVYSKDRSTVLFEKGGDIYLYNVDKGKIYQITKTRKREFKPYFTCNESKIAFSEDNNIYCWDISTGFIEQMTDFVSGLDTKIGDKQVLNRDKWLEDDQLKTFSIISKQEEKKKNKDKKPNESNSPLTIYLNGMELSKSTINPDGNYVVYLLNKEQKLKGTLVPNYVTKSGYTENINSRSKVGELPTEYKMFIYNIQKVKTYEIDFTKLPGINDLPAYLKDYPNNKYQNKNRIGNIRGPYWNSAGNKAFIDIKANDNKDRWLALIDFENGALQTLDRQHDDAWIDGPGIGYFSDRNISLGWMPDDYRIWFQSEESGYSHLYVLDTQTCKKKALTSGAFEIYNPFISRDKQNWYFSSNQNHPGVINFYRMPLEGGKIQQLTNLIGNNDVYLSPDESKLAIRYSYSNKPWELYFMNNPAVTGKAEISEQITFSITEKFKSYAWKVPEIISFKAQDGKNVYARLYKPKDEVKNKAAIIFVHGAGYLQNAHQWWSSYFREFMFHNLLVDNGYTVLDIDYRGSAGYGRDWRTGIYRHMGGKDLDDHVDGANYLVKNLGVDKNKIGIYGGSYGGFITLMALFKAGDTFKAGAAIRSVADWAHYNNSYTSNILNSPINDSIAYYQSSPIYYANGLNGHLLMLHGMIDDNVHFQDVVRLSQKLIELGKENWDLAIYPIERHAFVEPSSWTDEYTRIFKFFKNNLIDK